MLRQSDLSANTNFTDYLLDIATNRTAHPQFLDEKGYLVLPRIAKQFGFKANDKLICILKQTFADGDFSKLTSKDNVTNEEIYFCECTFGAVSFAECDFTKLNVGHSSFSKTNFNSAKLTQAHIQFNANGMVGVNFDNADLSGSQFDAIENSGDIANCSFVNTNLARATLDAFQNEGEENSNRLQNNSFLGSNLSGANLRNFKLLNNIFDGIKADNLQIASNNLTANRFTNAKLNQAYLRNVFLMRNVFRNFSLANSDLSSTTWDVEGGCLDSCSINANRFLYPVTFENVNADNARLLINASASNETYQVCATPVAGYFKQNGVTLFGNNTFGQSDFSWECSPLYHAMVVGLPLFSVGALYILCCCLIMRNSQKRNYQPIPDVEKTPLEKQGTPSSIGLFVGQTPQPATPGETTPIVIARRASNRIDQ